MHTELSDEELNQFLKDAGVFDSAPEAIPKKEEPLENLIEEIIGSIHSTPHSLPEQKIEPKRQGRALFPLFPLFICIAFLGGILLGTIFGFYWGTIQRVEPVQPSFEVIDAKITQLVQQIQEIYEQVTPTIPPEEIIEPLLPPEEEVL